MTKNEFKQKCKEEKAPCWKLMQWGGTAAIIGLLIVLLTYFFIDAPSVQIAGFAAGGVLALTGIILDLIGEIIVAKNYKNQTKQDQK